MLEWQLVLVSVHCAHRVETQGLENSQNQIPHCEDEQNEGEHGDDAVVGDERGRALGDRTSQLDPILIADKPADQDHSEGDQKHAESSPNQLTKITRNLRSNRYTQHINPQSNTPSNRQNQQKVYRPLFSQLDTKQNQYRQYYSKRNRSKDYR